MSEYEEYRQKYQLFDTALFLMPPDHPLRKLCHTILHKQMSKPTSRPLKDTDKQSSAITVLQFLLYLLR